MFAVVTFTDISEQKRRRSAVAPGERAAGEAAGRRLKRISLLAARVQQSLAPQSLVWGSMRVDTYYHPVRTIGGDFGLVSPLDERSSESAGVRRFRARHRVGAGRQPHLQRDDVAIGSEQAAGGNYAALESLS